MSDRKILTVEEVIPDYKSWLHHTVHRMTRNEAIHDDLVQEGYIAMWRALKTYDPSKGALPSWLTVAAYRRLVDLLNGKPITGREGVGQGVSRDKREFSTESMQSLIEKNDDWDVEDFNAVDALSEIIASYHRGEIAQAIDRLSPKQKRYVELRFWQGMQSKELTQAFGYDATGLWRAARKNLAEDLAHLRSLVTEPANV